MLRRLQSDAWYVNAMVPGVTRRHLTSVRLSQQEGTGHFLLDISRLKIQDGGHSNQIESYLLNSGSHEAGLVTVLTIAMFGSSLLTYLLS